MKCGDVYLAHCPFTDVSLAKLRPVVVASIDELNVGLSSELRQTLLAKLRSLFNEAWGFIIRHNI